MAIFRGDNQITFTETGHAYTFIDRPDIVPVSVTKVIHRFMEEFDEKRVSYYVARKNLRGLNFRKGMPEPSEPAIKREQIKVLTEWHKKRDDAIEHGSYIHNTVEEGFNGMPVPSNMAEIFNAIWTLFSKYAVTVPEPLIGLHSKNITGRPDYICYRKRSSNIIDIKDIKTNLSRGIYFDSTLLRDGKIKHYDRFMLPPVSHLEDCNYNHYCLQLSLYAYILEKQYGFQIGSLEIIYVQVESEDLRNQKLLPEFNIKPYPVAYLRSEAKAMIDRVYQQDYSEF